ncbi:MAG: hypothetical protein U9R57_06300 [Thermodesulfobacteriota bacterium]|nr:hypothetical protein [Thermodesulfobacteriota bacterium]
MSKRMYLLKVRLLDIISLDRLHDVIQIVMGCKTKLPVSMVQERALLKMLAVFPAILTFTVSLLTSA